MMLPNYKKDKETIDIEKNINEARKKEFLEEMKKFKNGEISKVYFAKTPTESDIIDYYEDEENYYDEFNLNTIDSLYILNKIEKVDLGFDEFIYHFDVFIPNTIDKFYKCVKVSSKHIDTLDLKFLSKDLAIDYFDELFGVLFKKGFGDSFEYQKELTSLQLEIAEEMNILSEKMDVVTKDSLSYLTYLDKYSELKKINDKYLGEINFLRTYAFQFMNFYKINDMHIGIEFISSGEYCNLLKFELKISNGKLENDVNLLYELTTSRINEDRNEVNKLNFHEEFYKLLKMYFFEN